MSIIKLFRDNKELEKSDLGYKEPLLLSSDDDTKSYIVRYYEYDVTVFVYKNSKLVNKYQEYYADLSDEILEKIHEQIQNYSDEHKSSQIA